MSYKYIRWTLMHRYAYLKNMYWHLFFKNVIKRGSQGVTTRYHVNLTRVTLFSKFKDNES